MKALMQYITEASKAVKEFESALGLTFPSKAKVKDQILTFDLDEKKYKSWNGWYTQFVDVYNSAAKNVTVKTAKDESELDWDFGADSPKGNEKWIKTYVLTATNGDNYEMIETQVRNHKTYKDTYYIAIKKA